MSYCLLQCCPEYTDPTVIELGLQVGVKFDNYATVRMLWCEVDPKYD